jgi:hypothetical protein
MIKLNLNLRAPKKFCLQLVSNLFLLGGLRTPSLVRQIFLLVKKSITLLTCYVTNNYVFLFFLVPI